MGNRAANNQVATLLHSQVCGLTIGDRLLDICRKGGCVPNIVREALTWDEILDAISTVLDLTWSPTIHSCSIAPG